MRLSFVTYYDYILFYNFYVMIINPIYVGFIVVPPFNLRFVFWYSFFPFFSFSLFILARGSSNFLSLRFIFKVRFSTVNPLFVFHLLLSLFLLLPYFVAQGFLYSTFKNLLDLNAQYFKNTQCVFLPLPQKSAPQVSTHTVGQAAFSLSVDCSHSLTFFFIIFCYY